MKQTTIRIKLPLIFLLVVAPLPLLGSLFYRINSEHPISNLHLDSSGFLHWSNTTPTNAFVVERTPSINKSWKPIARGFSTSSIHSIQVTHPGTPYGFVFVPASYYTRGDVLNDHRVGTQVHRAHVSPFFIQTHEVTNESMRFVLQWALVQNLITVSNQLVLLNRQPYTQLYEMGRFGAEFSFQNGTFVVREGRETYPVAWVTWYGAVAYCHFLSLIEGRPSGIDLETWTCDFSSPSYRLPTEGEWERAARAGFEGLRFPWTDVDTIDHSRANYRANPVDIPYDANPYPGYHPIWGVGNPRSSPVGSFPSNDFGIYDLIGNVWEWCWDWSDRFARTEQFDPTGPSEGTFRIFRGGSAYTTAERTTTAIRYRSGRPENSIYDVGFRMVIPVRSPMPPLSP